MEPIWEELGNSNDLNVQLAKVNCKEAPEACKSIHSFPTLKLMRKDKKEVSYSGARDKVSLNHFIRKMNSPLITSSDLADFGKRIKSLLSDKRSVVLSAIIKDDEMGSALYKAFHSFSQRYDGFKIIYLDEKSQLSYSTPLIQLHTNFESNSKIYTFQPKSLEIDQIEKEMENWISIYDKPIFIKFDKSIHVLENKNPLLFAIIDTTKNTEHFEVLNIVSQNFADKPITFCWKPLSEENDQNMKRVKKNAC